MMVDDTEREHWIRSGHAMFSEFMQRVEKIDRIGVKGMNESAEEHRVTLIDKRKVYGTLEEIADLYVSDEKKLVLDFTESRAMAVFHSPSADHPMEYIGFRWSYYKTPSRLVRSQDFFYLETMKPFVDVYGRRGWAKCSHSIEHAMCPDNSRARDINRGRLYYSGVVFVEGREKGVLETTFYYSLDTTSIPGFLLPVVMKARGKNNAALINHYVKLARVSAYAERTNVKKLKQQLVEEKRCGACSNRMPKWSSKTKCEFCKSFVCKRCCEIVSKNYLFDGEASCNSCMLCAETHGSKITSLMDDGESSSSTTEEARVDSFDRSSDVAETPGANATPHRHASFLAQKRLDRCNSMTASASPPKLLDFGLDEIDLVLRKHEAPAAAARCQSSTVHVAGAPTLSLAPSSAPQATPRTQSSPALVQAVQRPTFHSAPPSSSSTLSAAQPQPHSAKPPPHHQQSHQLQQQPLRRGSQLHCANSKPMPRDPRRGVPSRRHIERSSDSLPATRVSVPGSTRPHHHHSHHHHHHHAHRPRHFSEDETTRARLQAKQIAYTRENPCDLSYLSAFKV